MNTDPQSLINLYDSQRADSSGMFGIWDECNRMTLTRKVQTLSASISRTAHANDTFTPLDAAIVNSAAVNALDVHASGCVSWITPSDGRWFKYEPQTAFRTDPVISWLADCTDITLMYLGASNFYTLAHEVYIDRAVTGTVPMICESGKRGPLNFRVFDPGSYIIQDDEEGYTDMLFRERSMTNRAAFEKWGDKCPDEVKTQKDAKPQALRSYIHVVYPRSDEDRTGQQGQKAMPFGECWIDRATKTKLSETGFNEIPFFANRYLRWSEYSPWGVSPAMQALAEIRGVNYLDLLSTTLAEVTVNPRVILPMGFSGVPDLRAGGITIGGRTQKENPQEWLTGGRFDIGENIVLRKEAVIREIFHAPLFEQFREIEKQITAAEVHAREAERVARFSPAFTRLTTELLNPLLERVFMLLLRAGLLPPIPQEAVYMDAGGTPRIAFPQVVHTSRMALAIQSLRQGALNNWLAMAMPLAQVGDPVLDNLDSDVAFRDIGIGSGMPPAYLKSAERVAATRDARAKAQMAQQQQMMALELAKSKPIAEAGVKALTGQQAA